MGDDAMAAQAAAADGAPAAPDEPTTDGLTLDAIQAELKRVRREAASYRTFQSTLPSRGATATFSMPSR